MHSVFIGNPRRLAQALLPALLLSNIAQADDATLLRVGPDAITLARAREDLARLAGGRSLPEEQLRSLIWERYVPRLRLETHAAQIVNSDSAFKARIRPQLDASLAQALEHSLNPTVSDPEVAAFYQANLAAYQRPPAVRIWRILTNTRDQALKIIAEVKDTPEGAARFGKLAREHSVDTATNMRGGDLGFVQESGQTDIPQVRVNRALFEAASQLKDGELVAEPVSEGSFFAVVWRRGTRPERSRTLDQEADTIRGILLREKRAAELTTLMQSLRKVHLTAYEPELLDATPFPRFEGLPLARPTASPHAAQSPPAPNATGR